ncbi:nickel transport system ATP-binding protein [Desulfotomaculum arcticum]|uniref:Nickel import system ATP-binding protein NikD n=1 Tax=Desulfotruncus arcticus DSM 17038 TaxID=1121424 RepID=A0A1I2SYT7_9FIRM|nr:ABC transporter ATP-binding protein [Desulfotruncus arcticus]SFG57778.1 nickel transport system ATP-binding protein [Desulfotomaculum arcticum] [Desulfotruncus arcticus DSM 17038]
MNEQVVLNLKNFHAHLPAKCGVVRAVNGISLQIARGRVLGLVGESGCGKSITCLSLLGLTRENGWVLTGEAQMQGKNLLALNAEAIRRCRGKEIAIIMQNPMAAFNPLATIGQHFTETIRSHLPLPEKASRDLAIKCLGYVGLPQPEKLMGQYSFQLSGGMLQRVMIAIALAMEPKVLIADEPTTSLDVTVQRQILGQLIHLKEKSRTGMLLVSHDLGVIAQMADDVAVMYCGYIVELAAAERLFNNPLHPYTRALLASKPQMRKKSLQTIGGQAPSLLNLARGCPFFARCSEKNRHCSHYSPELIQYDHRHLVGCAKYAVEQRTLQHGFA